MIIYKATNKINGKSYIGQTVKSLEARKREHFKLYHNFYFARSLKKYGKENFKWEVLEHCDSKEEMDEMEFHYIKQYNTFKPNGYNLTYGGEGNLGWKPTDETKKNISKSKKGKLLGKENPFYGKKHSEKAKQKMRENHWCNRIDYSIENHPMYGKKLSEETKRKIGTASKGRWLDKKHTKKAINKIRKAKSDRWLIIFPNNTSKIIENLSNFCKENRLIISSMSMVASNKYKYKKHKGFKCKKLHDMEIRRIKCSEDEK